MAVILIEVPYHLGQENVGMGAGPTRYAQSITAYPIHPIRRNIPFENEQAAIININAQITAAVQKALEAGDFPLILGGNCNVSLGALAAQPHSGIVWFDAHGDFNTPETSPSGFFDGMGLAIASGRCHTALWEKIGGRHTLADDQIVLAGVRDLDPPEAELLRQSAVQVITAAELKQHGLPAMLQPGQDIHLHLDIDVLDPQESPGNEFNTVPNGLTLAELIPMIQHLKTHFNVRSAALTAYNPAYDPDGKTLQAGLNLIQVMTA